MVSNPKTVLENFTFFTS